MINLDPCLLGDEENTGAKMTAERTAVTRPVDLDTQLYVHYSSITELTCTQSSRGLQQKIRQYSNVEVVPVQ